LQFIPGSHRVPEKLIDRHAKYHNGDMQKYHEVLEFARAGSAPAASRSRRSLPRKATASSGPQTCCTAADRSRTRRSRARALFAISCRTA
jgi:hypothetical protein